MSIVPDICVLERTSRKRSLQLTMGKNLEDQIIQVSKEVTIKFIEVGRISPSSFPDTFKIICSSVSDSIKEIVKGNLQEIK